MEPTIQHKLANLEIAPPQGGWEILSARLAAEYDQAEIQVAQRLNDTVLMPPASAWASIAAHLPVAKETEKAAPVPAKLFSFPFGKVAAVAAVLILLSFVSWFLLRPGNSKAPTAQTDPAGTNAQAPANPPSITPNSIAAPPALAQEIPVVRPKPLPVEENNHTDGSGTAAVNPDLDQPDLPSADPSLVRAQDLSTAVSIPNRAYRDAAGKIVMDMNLLTTPGNHYVTVTAPNGEQTRISRKFLPVLTFVNTGADNGQFNATLKQKIQELRKQLLQQASFIPSATNFFDIMELKELLQDK